MKTFEEWLKKNHPDHLVEENWKRNLAVGAALASGAMGLSNYSNQQKVPNNVSQPSQSWTSHDAAKFLGQGDNSGDSWIDGLGNVKIIQFQGQNAYQSPDGKIFKYYKPSVGSRLMFQQWTGNNWTSPKFNFGNQIKQQTANHQNGIESSSVTSPDAGEFLN